MVAFEYRQAEEIREAFAKHGVGYLFWENPPQFSSATQTRPKTQTFFLIKVN